MKSQFAWEREERRIYIRDLFFLSFILFLTIVIAELFVLDETDSLTDRVFAYVFTFIPLGTINLIGHYYYRNLRIRQTGNLRTSLRYRLSLAFMLVLIIPSVPIFLISSRILHKVDDIPASWELALGLVYMFMILFALLLSWFLARQISTPIVTLAQATRAVAEGKLDTTLETDATGEMGLLIESFNQMTTELQSLRTRLLHSQRLAAWQEVAKRLAHEIKNPLTPIQLSAQRMLRRLDHPERGNLENLVQNCSTTIVEQVQVLKHLVEEFVEFARMPEARPAEYQLEPIVSESVKLFTQATKIPIEIRAEPDLPVLWIDKVMVLGMTNNLIKNAIEAIDSLPSGEKTHKIIISLYLQRIAGRHYVTFRIEDSGPGIDESQRDKIFEPYYSTKGEHGTGLGLSLVERTLMEHDGRIQIGRSAVLGGADFRILFRLTDEQDENLRRRR